MIMILSAFLLSTKLPKRDENQRAQCRQTYNGTGKVSINTVFLPSILWRTSGTRNTHGKTTRKNKAISKSRDWREWLPRLIWRYRLINKISYHRFICLSSFLSVENAEKAISPPPAIPNRSTPGSIKVAFGSRNSQRMQQPASRCRQHNLNAHVLYFIPWKNHFGNRFGNCSLPLLRPHRDGVSTDDIKTPAL